MIRYLKSSFDSEKLINHPNPDKKKKQNNVISTLIGISDSVVYGSILGVPSYFAESMDVMRNKWYVEKVHFRYRDYENPTVGSEEGLM